MPSLLTRVFGVRTVLIGIAAALAAPAIAQAQRAPGEQSFTPPEHTADWPQLVSGNTREELVGSLDAGPQFERGRSPQYLLGEHRKLDRALSGLKPQRKGVVDAYVVSIAMDSDPVFGREAREAGKVLQYRYDAVGRTIVLAGTTGRAPSELAAGTPETLALALARVAEVMDKDEDVLVLYTTSHGAKVGLAYHDGDDGYGIVSPARLASILDGLGIKNRVLLISACYSGIFVPALASDTTVLFTAASSERPSFGCLAENDWTFFGDALINHALRKPQPLEAAGEEARGMIGGWELSNRLRPSQPQASVGAKVSTWLKPLEARMPRTATKPVGKPATEALSDLRPH
ncbi:MAG: C13 family peptidase [Pseudomonadota bacterium]